ncbi:cytochrome b/b6 domain-containing protein [Paraburkholderia sp. D15]|uniref:cytochrome b n=1 Tax=Paraburkholderia sp. D15 TaxID=2880218 RepID=UPI00247980EE|nr:cytochrome b/b6 domain-containing protein [Paraburkholderia sp. D15]WGS52941.1 cytochrome b/b6 domain-containing protein [Paraburkholderia sp. D15]WKF61634.1 Cytochrome b561 [Paraburkholderia busanensis]
MPYPRETDRYTKPAIFFHWAIFLLVALAYLAIEIRGPKGSDSRVFWSNVHFCAGNLVLGLAVLRLLWRLWAGAPAEIDTNRLLAFLARAAHLALYVFIFAQPLLGILMINAGGHPVTLAWVNVSYTLIGADPAARPLLKGAHEWLGNAFYWVIGLHALAAIAHHAIFKDRTLRRMI